MPNPKLETYKNKATGTVYDFTDADAQSKISATVDLLDNTVGWIGKNRCPITITNQTQVDVGLVVNADKSVTLNGTPTGNYSFPLGTVTNFNIGDKFVISGCPEGGGEDTYNIFVVCRDSNNTSVLAVSQYGADVTFTVPANTVKIDVYARVVRAVNGSTISNKTFYTMIDTSEQHSLSPTYEPYHESVEEMLDKSLVYRGVIPSSANLNDYKSWGVYEWENHPTNAPENVDYASMFVYGDKAIIYQEVTKVGNKYTRRYNIASDNWSNWFKYTGTELT